MVFEATWPYTVCSFTVPSLLRLSVWQWLTVLPSLPLLLWHLWLLQCLAVQRCHSAERGWRVVEFCAGQSCLPFWCKLLGLSALVCGFYHVLFCEDFWGTGGRMGLFHWSLFISISSFVRAFLLLLLLLMIWFAIALLIDWFACFLNPSTATMSPENNQYNLEIWNLSSSSSFFFFFFFFALWKDFYQNSMPQTKICYRNRKHVVCRPVCALFSPEILQAVAVKGLKLPKLVKP